MKAIAHLKPLKKAMPSGGFSEKAHSGQENDSGGVKSFPGPGKILKDHFMAPLGLSAYRVAKDLGVAQIGLSEILRGRRGISVDMAVRLGRYFGVPATYWLRLQAEYELLHMPEDAAAMMVMRCSALDGKAFQIAGPRTQAGAAKNDAAGGNVRVVIRRTP
jgi:antitoxin HigA-1